MSEWRKVLANEISDIREQQARDIRDARDDVQKKLEDISITISRFERDKKEKGEGFVKDSISLGVHQHMISYMRDAVVNELKTKVDTINTQAQAKIDKLIEGA